MQAVVHFPFFLVMYSTHRIRAHATLSDVATVLCLLEVQSVCNRSVENLNGLLQAQRCCLLEDSNCAKMTLDGGMISWECSVVRPFPQPLHVPRSVLTLDNGPWCSTSYLTDGFRNPILLTPLLNGPEETVSRFLDVRPFSCPPCP